MEWEAAEGAIKSRNENIQFTGTRHNNIYNVE